MADGRAVLRQRSGDQLDLADRRVAPLERRSRRPLDLRHGRIRLLGRRCLSLRAPAIWSIAIMISPAAPESSWIAADNSSAGGPDLLRIGRAGGIRLKVLGQRGQGFRRLLTLVEGLGLLLH